MTEWTSTPTIITAASIGHVLEWFDYGVYSYFATIIAVVIFGKYGASALLLTFLAFGIGLAFRPLGSIFFAHYGDKIGRKNVLLITFWIMGAGTLLTGLTPSWVSIGIWAGVLMTVWRVLQGFAAGGEWGGVGTYLVELGGAKRRGFFSSFQQVFILASILIGDLVGLYTISTFHGAFLDNIAWRIPFIVGGVILIPTAFILRRGLPESILFKEVKVKKEIVKLPLAKVFVKEKKAMFLQLIGMLFTPITFYTVLTYLPAYVISETKLPKIDGFLLVAIGALTVIILAPLWGYLSDRWKNRRTFFLIASVGGAILSYPLFLAISTRVFALAIVAVIVLEILLSTYNGTINAFIAESFPTNDRYSGFIPYNISTAYSGGFASFIAIDLIAFTHNPLSPSFYMIAGCIASAIAIVFMKDAAKLEKLPETESIYYSDVLTRTEK
ncbi:MAG: MFS transporter [Candidatus Thermoplasmatota archaeon]|jgi:MHS family proline/betaine transporter-like MFS transporter|nr:MFS transporter [Candidatus Thermoplasmatota archaeon]MCL6002166.1 MFS transporter [Candidatus Thermoplasmatota archaeon]